MTGCGRVRMRADEMGVVRELCAVSVSVIVGVC